jgi:hypothetical protein
MRRDDSCEEFPEYGDSLKVVLNADVAEITFEMNMKQRGIVLPESFYWRIIKDDDREDFSIENIYKFIEEEMHQENSLLFVNIIDEDNVNISWRI